MAQKPTNALCHPESRQLPGIAVRSHLRAGTVLQLDIPAITAVQQEAQTPAVTITTTTT